MRIIRFIAPDGHMFYGEDHEDDTASILQGSIVDGFQPTSARVTINTLLAPLVPADIICIGRNYRAKAANQEAASDERPQSSRHDGTNQREEDGGAATLWDDSTLEVFLKPSTALQHPNGPILIPAFESIDPQLDCEGELAVVIGREARNVSESDALQYIFGYTIANDVTARAFQTLSGGGPPLWMRGKGFDTFCPLGPAIITADEIADPQSLDLRTSINGQTVRHGNTREMIRTVPQIIAALSRHMTLRSGAVILTGAPPALNNPQSINDERTSIAVEIDRIGRLQNGVKQCDAS